MPYKDPLKQKEAKHRSYLRNKEKVAARKRARRLKNPGERAEEYARFKERLLADPERYELVLRKSRESEKRYRESPEGKAVREKYRQENIETYRLWELARKYIVRHGAVAVEQYLINQARKEIGDGKQKAHGEESARRVVECILRRQERKDGCNSSERYDNGGKGNRRRRKA